jgi:tetratricopeptide (TPR) repeat protein
MNQDLHQPNIDQIKLQISNGNCLFVVGAGLSIYSTNNSPCSSWSGLLRNGIERIKSLISDSSEHPKWDRLYESNVEVGNIGYLNLADSIFEYLSKKKEFARWLADSIGTLPLTRRDLIESLVSLNTHVLSTNYDVLIEKATGMPKLTIDIARSVLDAISPTSQKAVVHLHGVYDRPDSVVFSRAQYARHINNQVAQVVEKAISLSKTLVFIGVGDGVRDPHFEELLDWIGTHGTTTETRQYILLTKPEMANFVTPAGLVAVPYGEGYSSLPDFLRKLQPFKIVKGRRRQLSQNPAVETALAQYDVGSHDAALGLIEQFEQESIPEEYAWEIRLMRAKNLMRLNQFEKALEGGRSCAEFFRGRDTVRYISSDAVVNTILRDTEKWQEAVNHAEAMVASAEQSGIAAARCSAFHSLARSQALLQLPEAVHSAQRCLNLAREPKERGKAALALGEAYRHLGKYDKARQRYLDAIEVSVSIGRIDLYIWSKLGLHDTELLLGEIDKAGETLDKVEKAVAGKEGAHPLESRHVALCRATLLFIQTNFLGNTDPVDGAVQRYQEFGINWPAEYVALLIHRRSIPGPKHF